jgi:hypothetical protein
MSNVNEEFLEEVTELTDFLEDSEVNEVSEKKGKVKHKAGRAGKPKSRLGTYEHNLRININKMVKECEENGISIFVAYLGEHEGWVYNAVFPEEVGEEEEYGKFNQFLRIVIGWDKEKALKQISVRKD